MHQLESYGNDIYLFTHKKPFVNNTYVHKRDTIDAFAFAYDMTFGGKGKHRQRRSGGKKHRTNGEIFVDAFQGKIAEFGFYNYFSDKGYDITRPDVDTYPLNQWDSFDFCINDSEIAVKSTKEYGNLLLLETKDWNKDGCYIPNIGTEHAEYDYFVLVRVKSDLKRIMIENNWLKSNFVSKETLDAKTKGIKWQINIVGFMTKDEFIDEVIDEGMILKQNSKLGTVPEKTTVMDAANYYVQAGDLHEIENLSIEVHRKIGGISMGEIDLKKLETSIEYLKRMAEGKNPINNEPLEKESVLNNPNVIRCLYFVEDVLRQVYDADGKIQANKKKKDFPLTHVQNFGYRKDLSITHFVEQLNEGLDETLYKKLSYTKITAWLKLAGYLNVIEDRDNKNKTMPSVKGRQLGIYTEERESMQGRKYEAVIYKKEAQEFIVNNMANILEGIVD